MKNYGIVVAVRDTKEDAELAAEDRMHWEKCIKQPLDAFFETYEVAGQRFETQLHYLHPKFERYFTEPERRRFRGLPAQIVLVDEDKTRLECLLHRLTEKVVYELSPFNDFNRAISLMSLCLPEILVLRCRGDGTDGLRDVDYVRKSDLHPKIILHGEIKSEMAQLFFNFNDVYYFVSDLITMIDTTGMMTAVEKTINHPRPQNIEDFMK